MKLTEKLKEYEGQFMFIRWATGGEYGKLKYVGSDFRNNVYSGRVNP